MVYRAVELTVGSCVIHDKSRIDIHFLLFMLPLDSVGMTAENVVGLEEMDIVVCANGKSPERSDASRPTTDNGNSLSVAGSGGSFRRLR